MFRKEQHKKCQNGEQCVGPGCKATTGKTARDRGRQTETRESKK